MRLVGTFWFVVSIYPSSILMFRFNFMNKGLSLPKILETVNPACLAVALVWTFNFLVY